MNLEDTIEQVRGRVAAACTRSWRKPESVRLVAVSKTVSAERIRRAYEAGLRDFGENRVQEAAAKRAALADLAITWHLVGHLQSNKAKEGRRLFQVVHSVDSVRLAERLEAASPPDRGRLPVLIQVNLGQEATKSGVEEAELRELVEKVSRLETLELRGLMVLPPYFDDPERTRPYFRRLRELAQEIDSWKLPDVSMADLSAGMSHDFEVAIEEGATIVRVGTALFGPRIP